MNWKDCLKISWNNIMTQKKICFRIVLGMSIIVVILFCVAIYTISYHDYICKFDEKHLDECYYVKYVNETFTEDEYNQKSKLWLERKEALGISDICILNSVEINKTTNMRNISLQISDRTYKKNNIYATCNQYFGSLDYDVGKYTWTKYDSQFDLFSENIIKKFQQKYPEERYMIGDLPDEKGELLLSDLTLMCLGVPKAEQESLIGETISIVLKDGKDTLLKDYCLSGIYNAHILPIQENSSFSNFCINNMVICFRSEEKIKTKVQEIRYYLDSYQNYSNPQNIAYIENNGLDITKQGNIYRFARKEMNVIQKILLLLSIFVVVAVTICIKSLLFFYWKKKISFLCMMRALGMQKKYQLTVIVIELVLLVLLSVVMGTYTAILLMALTSGCYGSILNFEIKLELRNIFFICMVIFIYLMVNMDVLSVGNKMKIADNG